jgi:hypothetical protein
MGYKEGGDRWKNGKVSSMVDSDDSQLDTDNKDEVTGPVLRFFRSRKLKFRASFYVNRIYNNNNNT